MSITQLLDYCHRHAAEIARTAGDLARLESPSTDKAAVDRCGRELASRLANLGAAVETLPQPERGDHIRASFRGAGVPILVLGHFDTVWPVGTLATMPVEERDGRLFGPGTFDMKAGIAIAMMAIRALRASSLSVPAIEMLWTTDEEIGSGTSRQTIEAMARRARAVLVLEPSLPGGALKTSRKACGEFEITVHGVSAHAGLDPGRGASAIHELAAQIRDITALQDLANGISVNVGLIHGGSRPNVVAETATAVVDVRAPTVSETHRLEAAFRALQPRHPRTRLTVQGGFDRPPLERSDGVVRLFGLAREVASELGQPLTEGGAGGGSDGSFTAALGVPTLDGLGAVGDGAHAQHEHVALSALPERAALVAGLVTRLSDWQG